MRACQRGRPARAPASGPDRAIRPQARTARSGHPAPGNTVRPAAGRSPGAARRAASPARCSAAPERGPGDPRPGKLDPDHLAGAEAEQLPARPHPQQPMPYVGDPDGPTGPTCRGPLGLCVYGATTATTAATSTTRTSGACSRGPGGRRGGRSRPDWITSRLAPGWLGMSSSSFWWLRPWNVAGCDRGRRPLSALCSPGPRLSRGRLKRRFRLIGARVRSRSCVACPGQGWIMLTGTAGPGVDSLPGGLFTTP
jgi:hypothetical protein